MLANIVLPEERRYDERARAVVLRIADAIDALAGMSSLRGSPYDAPPGSHNHVDPNIAAGLRG